MNAKTPTGATGLTRRTFIGSAASLGGTTALTVGRPAPRYPRWSSGSSR
jgi:hypothetical protein